MAWTLSVCIPVYNSDVRALVAQLCAQIDLESAAQIDVVILDDASRAAFKALHQFEHPRVRVIELAENIGRAKIRNAFLKYTNSDYLLFIDGDSTVESPTFMLEYKNYLDKHAETKVLVGASSYQAVAPPLNKRLRWRYSTKRESLSYANRKANPSHGFKTNNFLVSRSILGQFPFDERLSGYGHEDTLFGLQMQLEQIQIEHIDNPVWNLNIDSNRLFIDKTDQALKNLLWINANYRFKSPELLSRLLAQYLHIKEGRGVRLIFLKCLSLATPLLKLFLFTGLAPLFVFDAYRLGRLYCLDKDAPDHLL